MFFNTRGQSEVYGFCAEQINELALIADIDRHHKGLGHHHRRKMPKLLTGSIKVACDNVGQPNEMVLFSASFLGFFEQYLGPCEQDKTLSFSLTSKHRNLLEQNARYELFTPPPGNNAPDADDEGNIVGEGFPTFTIYSVSMQKYVRINPDGIPFPTECDATEATVFVLEPLYREFFELIPPIYFSLGPPFIVYSYKWG